VTREELIDLLSALVIQLKSVKSGEQLPVIDGQAYPGLVDYGEGNRAVNINVSYRGGQLRRCSVMTIGRDT
jgi:hypothetical protein